MNVLQVKNLAKRYDDQLAGALQRRRRRLTRTPPLHWEVRCMPYSKEKGVWRFANGVKLWKRDLLVDQLELYRGFQAENLNCHEPEEEMHFLRALGHGAGIFLDIGAGVGYYSILARRMNPRIRVHAFNPDPAMTRQLHANLRLNQTGGVVVHGVALGDFSGECYLRLAGDYSGYIAKEPEKNSVRVQCVTLAQVLPSLRGPIRVTKIDVQGAELQVLQGAGSRLASLGRILVGTHSEELHRACLEHLQQSNFAILFEQGVVPRQYDGLIVAQAARSLHSSALRTKSLHNGTEALQPAAVDREVS